jgi:hypothetical protein
MLLNGIDAFPVESLDRSQLAAPRERDAEIPRKNEGGIGAE